MNRNSGVRGPSTWQDISNLRWGDMDDSEPSPYQQHGTVHIANCSNRGGGVLPRQQDSCTENRKDRRPVKVTLWRFSNTCLLLGLGTTKAVLAFQENPSADAFDVALGLVWAVM